MSRTLGRVVDILDCFTRERPTASLVEVADLTGFDRATTHRFLTAMEEHRLLRRDPMTKRYSLGGKLMEWGGLALGSIDVRFAAEPVLRRLNQETGETTALYVRDGNRRICVASYDSPERIRHVLPVGNVLRLTQAAGGRATLAFLPEDDALEIIRTDREIDEQERRELIADLPVVRARGYAYGVRLMTPHAWSIAAPVFDQTGEPVATLVIAGPDTRFSEEIVRRHAALLGPAAVEISQALGAPRERLAPMSMNGMVTT